MDKLKYIFRNINLLNIILISALVIMVNYFIQPVLNTSIKYTLSSRGKTVPAPVDTEQKPSEIHIPSSTDYMIIAEENLFHPERKIPVEKKAEQPLPKPDCVLYGTLISDSISLAYIEDLKAPITTPGRGKRQIALRKGDTLSGFILKEIEMDKIIMVRGDEKMTIYVHDPQKPKTREASAPALVPASSKAPRKPAYTPPRNPSKTTQPRTPITQKPKPVKTEVIPPKSAEEQSIVDFFER